MNIKYSDVAAIGGLVLGAGAFVVSIVNCMNTKKLAAKVGVSVDKLREMTEVEVSDTLVKSTVKAKVDKVVTERVAEASRKAVDDVFADMHRTIKKEVDEAVKDRSEAIKSGVEKRIEEQVSNGINVSELSKKIERNCEKKVMDQMTGVIEGVRKMATDELSSKLSAYNDIGKVIKGVMGN